MSSSADHRRHRDHGHDRDHKHRQEADDRRRRPRDRSPDRDSVDRDGFDREESAERRHRSKKRERRRFEDRDRSEEFSRDFDGAGKESKGESESEEDRRHGKDSRRSRRDGGGEKLKYEDSSEDDRRYERDSRKKRREDEDLRELDDGKYDKDSRKNRRDDRIGIREDEKGVKDEDLRELDSGKYERESRKNRRDDRARSKEEGVKDEELDDRKDGRESRKKCGEGVEDGGLSEDDERRGRKEAKDEVLSEEERRYERESRKRRRDDKGEVLSGDDDERKGRKEARRFDDGGRDRKERREGRRFTDRVKEEDLGSGERVENGRDGDGLMEKKHGSEVKVVSQEPVNSGLKASGRSAASHHPLPEKVSSITTNENARVSIRSDEVPGKSSTDGQSPAKSKSGSLSLDALAKAKKALQMQKELSEKLKKIPALNKDNSSTGNSQISLNKDANKVPLSTHPQVGVSSSTIVATSIHAPVGSAVSGKQSAPGEVSVQPDLASIPNIEAVKRAQELAAKMGFRQDPDFGPLINMFPGKTATDMSVLQKPAKAPVLRLDAQGREIDEHGNVINLPKLTNLSTLKVNINKQKKEAFQIIKPDLDAIAQSTSHFDEGMGINKTKLLRPKRMSFQFVEEGKWSKQAEIIKLKSQFGEAQAKELKMKQTQLAKAKAEPDINPNLIAVGVRTYKEKKKEEIPDIEWWDKPILPSGSYHDISEEKFNMEKITIYVEHPRPIEPPAEPAPPPPQPLKLTKKEQKKLRTQRRLAKERDRQEMIRQGLLEPPKAKVKMSNLMKVLGSEATQDPTKLEMEIRAAAAEREQAHIDRNIARKLTPAERREKKEKKLFDDSSCLETIVSVYKIKDLSHPQTRFKVDVNAQENRLTGCVVMSDSMSVVVVEGGRKPIKRYSKLMLKRINWAAAVSNEEEETDNTDSPLNSCVLVWQGSVAKPSFHRFIVHQCRSEAAARKVFADAGVPHYWDLSVNFTEELL